MDQYVNSRWRQAKSEFGDRSTDFLEGYVASYEESGPVHKAVASLTMGDASDNQIRYAVAKQILQRRELEGMTDEALLVEVENQPGFWASSKTHDRHRQAQEVLDLRTRPHSVPAIQLDLSREGSE